MHTSKRVLSKVVGHVLSDCGSIGDVHTPRQSTLPPLPAPGVMHISLLYAAALSGAYFHEDTRPHVRARIRSYAPARAAACRGSPTVSHTLARTAVYVTYAPARVAAYLTQGTRQIV